ncbi:thiamine phosphate synthase [Desulfosediminicola flagellatus]|uniref:thiamine phosphate synthase n=1 Tax=Desulfosediminicola flagellatus TaxID=2569541 RepID=UPI001E452BB3|nr:thiamine phosphate synthase [Desulfosediminicola flagellatus]
MARMQQFIDEVCVYPVTCDSLTHGRGDREWLDQVLSGGAKIVQLRDKESKDNLFLEKANYFRTKTREAGALFLVNDRLDIALLSDADGIHVGQGDLPPSELRKLAPDMIIGHSCNTKEQVLALADEVNTGTSCVSYYNVGPIYQTATKEGLHNFLGSKAIAEYTSACSLPFTVMGGIKFAHIDELLGAGVRRIAVVTAISQAADMAAETEKWQKKIREKRNRMDGVD